MNSGNPKVKEEEEQTDASSKRDHVNSNFSTGQNKVKEEYPDSNLQVTSNGVSFESGTNIQDFTANQLGFKILTMASKNSPPPSEVKREIEPTTSLPGPFSELPRDIFEGVKAEPFDAPLLNPDEKVVDLTNNSDDLEGEDSVEQIEFVDSIPRSPTGSPVNDDLPQDVTKKVKYELLDKSLLNPDEKDVELSDDLDEVEEDSEASGDSEDLDDSDDEDYTPEAPPPKKARKHQCDVCNKFFNRPGDLKNHYRVHQKAKKAKVKPLKMPAEREVDMTDESDEVEENVKDSGEQEDLDDEERTSKAPPSKMPEKFQCDVCSKFFGRPGDLKNHYRIHQKVKNAPATKSVKKRAEKEDSDDLVEDVSDSGDRDDPDDEEYTQKDSDDDELEEDVGDVGGEIDSDDDDYAPEAAADSKKPTSLKKIVSNKKTRFMCEVCNRPCVSRTSLIEHSRVHTGEKPFKCKVCKKRFTQQGSLTIHMRTHTGARPHICDVCDKPFRYSCDLTKHKRIHTGEEPYECEDCGKKYNQKTHLIRHRYIHTGERPYKCNVCPKGYTRNEQLKKHMKKHEGKKSFECEDCHEKFTKLQNLKRHRKSLHP